MSRLLRTAWGLERRRRERSLGVPHGSALPELPDDRFQARFAFYLHVANQVRHRRVLELGCGSGFGTPALLHREPHAVVALEGHLGSMRLAEQRNPSDAVVHIHCDSPPNRSGLPEVGLFDTALGFVDSWPAWGDNPEGTLDWVTRRLCRGQLYLAVPHTTAPSRTDWLEWIHERYHYCRTLRHLAPLDYQPRWDDPAPARARAQEHRFVAVADPSQPAPAESLYDVVIAAAPRSTFPDGELRLHVGAGPERLTGWVNIDSQTLPSVDVIADVTEGLPFENARAVFAEHFLEHLDLDAAIEFIRAAHDALEDGGQLRLVTPNLDWVVATQYLPTGTPEQTIRGALALNRGFAGWGHRFVWNRELLAQVLRACGFEELRWPGRQQSDREELRGLERHEAYEDSPDLPHVLVVDATRRSRDGARLEALRNLLDEEWEAGRHRLHED